MAKYLACLYQDGIDPQYPVEGPQEQTNGTQKQFVHGVFFLPCGPAGDSKSLLLQLWQDLGYQTLPMSSDGMPSILASEDAMHKQLCARLANLNVLIILDDVWDAVIIDRLLLQQHGIKYLITTQVPRLWPDAVDIAISVPTSQEANQILANHVKGFPQQVTSDIQDQINLIIEKSALNPLVLANVATNIGLGKASHLQEWKSTLRYLSDLQDGDGRRPVSLFGRTYSKRTMRASMEIALSSFSNEEQTLLFLASVCEIQPVPEVVFKTFFKIIHSSLAKFSRCCEQLETINFIQIENKRDPGSDIPQRSWTLHSMRQNFIRLIKNDEIALMFSKLLDNTENSLVPILLVLYGQESWRSGAARKLGIPESSFLHHTSKLGSLTLSSIRPFVKLIHADCEEEWQSQSHQATTQILQEYLLSGVLNKNKIVELLRIQETGLGACEALLQLTVINQKPLFTDNSDHIRQRLMTLLQQTQIDFQNQLKGVLFLLSELAFYNLEDAISIGSDPAAVKRLVELLGDRVNPVVQELAACTLGFISKDVVENSTRIGSYPGALDRLVGLLGERVSPGVQQNAALALGCLSKDVLDNATKIGSHPHALERLIELLGDVQSPGMQQNATWALGCLSKDVLDNATKIGSHPKVVERLVPLLGDGVSPGVQQNAAITLGCLSKDVLDNAIKIGSYPGAMEKLVGLLGNRLSPDSQRQVLQVLWYISCATAENLSLLRRAVRESPLAMEGVATLTRSEKHKEGELQYWGAKVYEGINSENWETVEKYQSSCAYQGKGDAKVSFGDYTGALEAFENGLAIEMDGTLVCRRCFVKAKLGDFEGALTDANKYIEVSNDRPFGLQERGVLRRMMGDLSGALADLNEALELAADDYERLKHRGLVKFLLKDEDGARADAEWALRIRPDRVDSYTYGTDSCLGVSSVEYLGYKLG